jgi:hypothetical protein
MELDGALECHALFPDVFVLDLDHAVVYDLITLLDGRLLVLKAGHTGTEGVHLVALADLEAERSHLILEELIFEVRAGPWVLADFL